MFKKSRRRRGRDGRACFVHDAHELMVEDIAMLNGRNFPAIQMEI